MIEDTKTEKKHLRKKILALRDALPPEERRKKSASIHLHLFSLPEFIAARSVAFFVSFRSEVLIDYTGDLAPGTWGIPEPQRDRVRPVSLEEIDLLITPGAAFDQSGQRVGYGGGFYDGVLKSFQKPSVALAYGVQLVEAVPTVSGHDQPVDIIITEDGIMRCNK